MHPRPNFGMTNPQAQMRNQLPHTVNVIPAPIVRVLDFGAVPISASLTRTQTFQASGLITAIRANARDGGTIVDPGLYDLRIQKVGGEILTDGFAPASLVAPSDPRASNIWTVNPIIIGREDALEIQCRNNAGVDLDALTVTFECSNGMQLDQYYMLTGGS